MAVVMICAGRVSQLLVEWYPVMSQPADLGLTMAGVAAHTHARCAADPAPSRHRSPAVGTAANSTVFDATRLHPPPPGTESAVNDTVKQGMGAPRDDLIAPMSDRFPERHNSQ